MKFSSNSFFVLAIAVFLIGCSTPPRVLREPKFTPNLYTSSERTKEAANYRMEPRASVGVKETEAILRGKVVSFEVIFPEALFDEMFPGRICWYGIVIDKHGYEHFAQLIFLEKGFWSGRKAYLVGALLVDAESAEELEGAKVLGLSTALELGYALDVSEQSVSISTDQFQNDPGYRRAMTEANGSMLSLRNEAKEHLNMVLHWPRFQTVLASMDGHILSPLGDNEMAYVAGINAQVGHFQKWIASGHFNISTNLVGTFLGNFFEFVISRNMRPNDWSFQSKRSERELAVLREYVVEMKEKIKQNGKQRGSP